MTFFPYPGASTQVPDGISCLTRFALPPGNGGSYGEFAGSSRAMVGLPVAGVGTGTASSRCGDGD